MKLVAQMLVKAGLTHLITVDLHQKEIQGFFDIPVDNLRASSFLLDYIQQQVIHPLIESRSKILCRLDTCLAQLGDCRTDAKPSETCDWFCGAIEAEHCGYPWLSRSGE